MKKILIVFLFLILLFSSCRPYEDLSRDFTPATTWGDLFDLYWKRMSTNYLFWELDYNGGKDWDRVYDEYMPLFSELGEIENNIESREKAYSYFYDIISQLSDQHYLLRLNTTGTYETGNGDSIRISPLYIKELSSLGYSKEDIIKYAMKKYDPNDPEFARFYQAGYDKPANVIDSLIAKGFKEIKTIKTGNEGDSDYFFATLLKNDDGIIYFGFSGFAFDVQKSDHMEFIEYYYQELIEKDIKGIIIDLRGNGGGAIYNLTLLWTPFFPEDVSSIKYADRKKKQSEGRVDYGPWTDSTVPRADTLYKNGHVDSSTPIAILQDENSVSCSEFTILFFRALKDNYGYNTATFGEKSAGGTGILIEIEKDGKDLPASEDNANGGITYDLRPYGTLLYTPYCMQRAYNGVIYEGVGIPADNEVEFSYDEFIASGEDQRINAAIEWINGGSSN